MPIDDARFKLAMSHFASGVTVVTTGHEEKQYGMTVASFASLSLHPPLVVVCIERAVKTHDAIAAAGHFGVSILGADQAALSNRFASKSDDKFSAGGWHDGELGDPLIDGAICQLECRVTARLDGGDHSIFIGEVEHSDVADGNPLLYWRSAYREIAG